jgi:hypothetical protein
MAIDDPIEKIRGLLKDGGFDGVGASLQVGGLVHPLFKVSSVAKNIIDGRKSGDRIAIAINALCDELQRMQEALPKEMEEALDTDWFKRALNALMEQSARAVTDDRARLLATAAAHGCFPTGLDAHRQEDLASYIEDLARLGTDDIQMLKLLRDSYKDVFKSDPNLSDPNRFTQHNEGFKRAAEELNIHPDDRLSLGSRLTGFGLAFEAVPQDEHFFRPTRRGLYLLSLLEAAQTPIEKQN